jgi:hypothetical protein
MATDHMPNKIVLMASTIRTATDYRIRPAPARIKKRAAKNPTPLFNSLSLAPGERVSWSQPTRSPGCFMSYRFGAIVPIDLLLRANSSRNAKVLSRITEFRLVRARFVAARNRPIYTEIRHFRAQSPPAAYSAGRIHASIGNDSPRDRPNSVS